MVPAWPSIALAAWFLLAATATAAHHGEVLELDLFRAMPQVGIGKWPLQNFNLASEAGVIKYVHTEVIAEHILGSPERTTRKYGVDAIARIRFKIRNPGSLLSPSNHLVTQVDFGPFVTYDSGVATNPQTQEFIKDHGGYVGVQLQADHRWPYDAPYFWFSVTGFCPNVRYDEVPMTRDTYVEAQGRRERKCTAIADEAKCRSAGVCDLRLQAIDVAPQCLNHSSTGGVVGKVLGGLCSGGMEDLSVVPTGEPDCTYSYGKADKLLVDTVTGLLDEDCGGRKCEDWLDFRRHCTNTTYRQKFDLVTKRAVPFKYCIEYDIHPFCEADCFSTACQALPEEEKELGLPFWRGKCDARSNARRAGHLWDVFAKQVDAGKVSANLMPTDQDRNTCVHETPGVCTPAPGQGGSYCTRQWAGVCSNCFIPGTREVWRATHFPHCPYDVLAASDYAGRFPAPRCASRLPRDLCCLYTRDCAVRASSAEDAPLDEDGFALVASWGNTSAMAAFLARAAAAS
eukprot:CAMPEP_0170262948 /NCGR_PEP_ID=MMETSP0116_2-20130129/31357_1 /TAXON_ID=400756 /ORGANISM="Durinskia baltica, Strain CSIRO CS-38" /LENGTH=512 /DNA_ID=CAMNT_0010514017 /DNA_START=54 /DNA_END=1590 /DNA_ORIENTATION=-